VASYSGLGGKTTPEYWIDGGQYARCSEGAGASRALPVDPIRRSAPRAQGAKRTSESQYD